MTRKINTYFSLLVVTVVGSAAALLIIHVANNATETQFVQYSYQYN